MKRGTAIIFSTLAAHDQPAPVFPTTVTLYTDVKAFTRALLIRTTRQIAVLVVTPTGEVLGHVSGRYSAQAAASINKVLNAGS